VAAVLNCLPSNVFRTPKSAGGPFGDINGYVFEDVMKKATPVGWLNTPEQASAKGFANQLI
jgi:hypothetical protein